MALYEYECTACGQRFELIQRYSDQPAEVCRLCGGGPVHKLLSAPAIQFKGTGWYITDYARKGDADYTRKSESGTAAAPSPSSSSASSPSSAEGGSKGAAASSSPSSTDGGANSHKSASSSDAGSASKAGSSGTGKA